MSYNWSRFGVANKRINFFQSRFLGAFFAIIRNLLWIVDICLKGIIIHVCKHCHWINRQIVWCHWIAIRNSWNWKCIIFPSCSLHCLTNSKFWILNVFGPIRKTIFSLNLKSDSDLSKNFKLLKIWDSELVGTILKMVVSNPFILTYIVWDFKLTWIEIWRPNILLCWKRKNALCVKSKKISHGR